MVALHRGHGRRTEQAAAATSSKRAPRVREIGLKTPKITIGARDDLGDKPVQFSADDDDDDEQEWSFRRK